MVTDMTRVAYSRKKNDPAEVYHPDPDCQHRKRIKKNGNACWHEMSTISVSADITVRGGRRLRICKDCDWPLQDEGA